MNLPDSVMKTLRLYTAELLQRWKVQERLGGLWCGGVGSHGSLHFLIMTPNSITLQPGSLESQGKLLQKSDSACD